MTNRAYDHQCKALAIAIRANVPTLLKGDPGVGKSSVLTQMGEDYDLHVEVVKTGIRASTDFGGLPRNVPPTIDPVTGEVLDEGGFVLEPPAWAKRLANPKVTPEGRGLLFLDEINQGTPTTQGAVMGVALERVVGELELPPEVRVVAAMNPVKVSAGGFDLKPPLANRFFHLEWDLPADVIAEGFTFGWPKIEVPAVDDSMVEKHLKDVMLIVGEFIKRFPELRNKIPKAASESGGAWPSARSWEMAAHLYAYGKAAGVDGEVLAILLNGTVGTAAAGQFQVYLRELDLPDPEDLLRDPASWTVPSDRQDKVYATMGSVWAAVLSDNTPDRWKACGEILAKIARANHADIAFSFGSRWAKDRPTNGMPSAGAVQALGPILTELELLIKQG